MRRHLINFGITVLVAIVFAAALDFVNIDFTEVLATQNFWLGFLYMALVSAFSPRPSS